MQSGFLMRTSHLVNLRTSLPCRTRARCGHVRPRQQRTRVVRAKAASDAATLLLDCDGVLVDTEAEGHRVSFNEAFKQRGEG